jgi:hypothetical protein
MPTFLGSWKEKPLMGLMKGFMNYRYSFWTDTILVAQDELAIDD